MTWKVLCHNDRLAELDPSYDGCPSACTRPEAEMRRGCPDCLVTSMYQEFAEETREEMGALAERKERARPGTGTLYQWPWSFEKLMKDINIISGIDARVNHKGYQLRWPTTVKHLVSILRQERANLRHAKDKERESKRNG